MVAIKPSWKAHSKLNFSCGSQTNAFTALAPSGVSRPRITKISRLSAIFMIQRFSPLPYAKCVPSGLKARAQTDLQYMLSVYVHFGR